MRNKKTIIIILIILLAIWGAEAIRSFTKHGTILIGNGWQPTPEDAIEYKIEYLYDRQWEEKKGSFEIRQMIDTIELENELSLTHFLGTHGVSLWECGDAKPSQAPLEPGALRAELCLGGHSTYPWPPSGLMKTDTP